MSDHQKYFLKSGNTTYIRSDGDINITNLVSNSFKALRADDFLVGDGRSLKGLFSNVAKSVYSNDLFGGHSHPTFVNWDSNTLNTPYKANLTSCTVGMGFCFGDSSFSTVVAITLGECEIFIRSSAGTSVKGWYKCNLAKV